MGFSDAAENYAHSSSQGIDRGGRIDVCRRGWDRGWSWVETVNK